LYSMQASEAHSMLKEPAIATLTWVEAQRKLWVLTKHRDTPDRSYVIMDPLTPVWQLTDGWSSLEGDFRWIAPHATARLQRPSAATRFEVVFNAGPQLIAALGHSDVRVRLNGVPIGSARLSEAGAHTVDWTLAPAPAGAVEVEFDADPPFHVPSDGRTLGISIMAFGFPP